MNASGMAPGEGPPEGDHTPSEAGQQVPAAPPTADAAAAEAGSARPAKNLELEFQFLRQALSAAQAREMWAPVTPIPLPNWGADLKPITPTSLAYALGWNVRGAGGCGLNT